jgi:protein-S-isoprenylcysteine O-methyltransferase Ste14
MTEHPGKTLDLDDHAKQHNWKLEIVPEEHPQERHFRQEQQAANAKLQRVKEVVLLGVTVFFILAMATSCMAISFSHETSPEDKKWAWATLTLITGAALGYLFGRAAPTAK